ncbi:MAG: dihydropteroate synthase [Rhizobiales bacterium]|nr:dihydropteroate synthase [Hyphomicrobiales bacterium]
MITPPPTPLAAPWPRRSDGRALLMGIVNVTPDSFSDGGFFSQAEAAIRHAESLIEDGADVIDIGGESTRPGSTFVPASEEMARVLPVISALHDQGIRVPISIDTYKSETAAAALRAGASIVNDVWGLQRDPLMAETVAASGAGLVIMHNRDMRDESLDIITDMERFFARSLELAAKAGIPVDRIALDPGIGFGKTLEQNLAAIRSIPRLKAMGHAVLLGVSRKSYLGLLTNRAVNERLAGTIASAMIGLDLGADILRVHDIAPHVDALAVRQALL